MESLVAPMSSLRRMLLHELHVKAAVRGNVVYNDSLYDVRFVCPVHSSYQYK